MGIAIWIVVALGLIYIFTSSWFIKKSLHGMPDGLLVSKDEYRAFDPEAVHEKDTQYRLQEKQKNENARKIIPLIVSLVVLAAALFLILTNRDVDSSDKKWAYGVVGSILGYWLKKD